MVAILSDIHSNLYALEAVLADMPKVSAVWVLGDTVGGVNPFPCQVIYRLMNLHVPVSAILGNWEEWAFEARHNIQPEWRNDGTKMAAGVWTLEALQDRHWNYLKSLGKTKHINDVLLFHGRPDDSRVPVLSQAHAEEVATQHGAKWLIGGHTHQARLFRVGDRYVVNVGSVGVSIDGIGGTACYALLDGDKLVFRHVAYDVDAAINAIKNSEPYKLAKEFAKETISFMKYGMFPLKDSSESKPE